MNKIYLYIAFIMLVLFAILTLAVIIYTIYKNKKCSGGGFHNWKYTHSDRISDLYRCTKCKASAYKIIPHY